VTRVHHVFVWHEQPVLDRPNERGDNHAPWEGFVPVTQRALRRRRRSSAHAIVDRIAAGLRAPELRASRLVAEPVAVLVADAVPVVGGSGRLSVRETEVLRLVARGFTNQRIASELSISERTVNSHLVHIFNKLVDNRVAAAMHAVRAGLADQAS
jgi:DNA-binding NarL/FixJ family response regulator